MKKITALLLVIVFVVVFIASCGNNNNIDDSSNSSDTTTNANTTPDTTNTTATTEKPQTTGNTKDTTSTVTDPEYTYEHKDGLIVHLAFDAITDGKIKDVTGNGHDATVIGEPQITSDGSTYKALRFRKAGQRVVIADCDELNFTEKDSFTAEIYFKWQTTFTGSNWPCLFQKGLSTADKSYNYFGLWVNSSTKMLNLGITGENGSGTRNLPSLLTLQNEWHQAVIIQNAENNTISFYIDGVLMNEAEAINASSKGQDLYIGNNGKDGQYVGIVDSFKVYNYAKDPSSYEKTLTGVDGMEAGEFLYTDPSTGKSVTLPYRVYYPTGYDKNSADTYPILFFLHGYGECGTDNMQQLRVLKAPNELLDKVVAADNCIIVAPQCQADPAENNWVPINKQWTIGSRELTEKPTISLAAATALLKEYLASGKVDLTRVYAAGISMGGYGTWELITRNPELFAAAIPVCGAGIPSMADKLVDIAIWAFHGTADGTVPMSGTKDMEDAIKAAGGTKMKATYIEGVGHNVWIPAYKTEGLIEWLFAQHK